jgi:hypothetical protein
MTSSGTTTLSSTQELQILYAYEYAWLFALIYAFCIFSSENLGFDFDFFLSGVALLYKNDLKEVNSNYITKNGFMTPPRRNSRVISIILFLSCLI